MPRRSRKSRPAALETDSAEALTPPTSSLAPPLPLVTLDSTLMARPLLLASLGNPAPYANTLHSAGHHLLSSLRQQLGLPLVSNPGALTSDRNSTTSLPLLAAWQSSTNMNVSGPAVSKAWKAFLAKLPPEERRQARLVVVHDELELELGKVKVREGTSVKGHNGLKSIAAAMGGVKGWWRLGVGIGRPDSREQGDVSGYVLREMTRVEREKVKGAVLAAVGGIEKIAGGSIEAG